MGPITYDEAKALVLGSIPVLGPEKTGLLESLGRVLARDVNSPTDLPARDMSTADGWAVRCADLDGSNRNSQAALRIGGEIQPDAAAFLPTETGICWKVHPGSAVPRPLDAVVEGAEASEKHGIVSFSCAPRPGDRVAARGSYFRKDEFLLGKGCAMRAAEVNLLSSLGIESVEAVGRPRVAVVATGSPAVEAGGEGAGSGFASVNLQHLLARTIEAGARPVNMGAVRDSRDAIAGALERARGCDAILATGGASDEGLGTLKAALRGLGAEILFEETNFRPGRTFAFARFGGMPVFCIPGSPKSIAALFRLFVWPSIQQMSGKPPADDEIAAILEKDLVTQPGTMKFIFSKLTRTVTGYSVLPMRDMPKGGFVTSDAVNALTIVPEDVAYLKSSLEVSVLPLHEV